MINSEIERCGVLWEGRERGVELSLYFSGRVDVRDALCAAFF